MAELVGAADNWSGVVNLAAKRETTRCRYMKEATLFLFDLKA
jgi:hypothetical protein